jgi:predicted XRE-type DNA-binding protein
MTYESFRSTLATMRKEEQKKKKGGKADRIEQSSGNVFADLGLNNPAELLAKAELVQRIADIIAERKLTQVRAAKLLGVDQPKVSALLRGKLDGFSIDRLFRFLNALGRDVEIVIRPAKHAKEAETKVVSA